MAEGNSSSWQSYKLPNQATLKVHLSTYVEVYNYCLYQKLITMCLTLKARKKLYFISILDVIHKLLLKWQVCIASLNHPLGKQMLNPAPGEVQTQAPPAGGVGATQLESSFVKEMGFWWTEVQIQASNVYLLQRRLTVFWRASGSMRPDMQPAAWRRWSFSSAKTWWGHTWGDGSSSDLLRTETWTY